MWTDNWFQTMHRCLSEIWNEGKDPDGQMITELEGSGWDEDEILGQDGSSFEDTLQLIKEKTKPGYNLSNGRYLEHIPGIGHYSAALGYFVGTLLNIRESPDSGVLESAIVQWAATALGFGSKDVKGYMATGGTGATVIGIDMARKHFILRGMDMERAVVYLSTNANFALMKSLCLLGLVHHTVIRILGETKKGTMDVSQLRRFMEQDKENGLEPFLVLATLGTTNLGAIDNLQDIGHLAKLYGAWFHVDGAYGGPFLLCDSVKKAVGDLSNVDSLVFDPHKRLYMPYGLGIVLVRNASKLCPQEHLLSGTMAPLKAFSMWFALNLQGTESLKSCLQEKLLLAKYFIKELQNISNIVADIEPELGIVAYRCKGNTKEESNGLSEKLFSIIQDKSDILQSFTYIDGYYYIRASVCQYNFHWTLLQRLLHGIISLKKDPFQHDKHSFMSLTEKDYTSQLLQQYELKIHHRDSAFDGDVSTVFATAQQWLRNAGNKACGTTGESVVKSKWNFPWNDICLYGKNISTLLDDMTKVLENSDHTLMESNLTDALAICFHTMKNFLTSVELVGKGGLKAELIIMEWIKKSIGFMGPDTICSFVETLDMANTLALGAGREYFQGNLNPHTGSSLLQIIIYSDNMDVSKYEQYMKFLGCCNFHLLNTSTLGSFNEYTTGQKHHALLLIFDCPSKMLQPRVFQELHSIRSNCECLWIHAVLTDINFNPLGPMANSVSIDLSKCFGLHHPLAGTMVRESQYLRKAVNDDRADLLAPNKALDHGPGLNLLNFSWEVSRPARFVPLWVKLHMKGLRNVNMMNV